MILWQNLWGIKAILTGIYFLFILLEFNVMYLWKTKKRKHTHWQELPHLSCFVACVIEVLERHFCLVYVLHVWHSPENFFSPEHFDKYTFLSADWGKIYHRYSLYKRTIQQNIFYIFLTMMFISEISHSTLNPWGGRNHSYIFWLYERMI